MITIKADFNHLDAKGRLRLEDLAMHRHTPFGEIAADHERVIFVDGIGLVEERLASDSEQGWIGEADWATQGVCEPHPAQVTAHQGRLERSRALGPRGDTVTSAGPGSGSPRCRGSR